MSLQDALRTAIRALAGTRLRSALTTLGLVIGVSSVIVLVAVGQGTQKGVTDQIAGLGTDLLFVEPANVASTSGAPTGPGDTSLTTEDAEALRLAGIPGVEGVSSARTIEVTATGGTASLTAEAVATDGAYQDVHGYEIAAGAFFTPEQAESGLLTAVVGGDVADELFGGPDAVGQSLRLSFLDGRISFEFVVAGVLDAVGGGSEVDGQVIVPIEAMLSRLRFLATPDGVGVSTIDIKMAPGTDQEQLKSAIAEVLTFVGDGGSEGFVIQSQDDLISAATEVSNALSVLLGSVAGISLLVGGIGVMNIMLVSVTERTREIGIRRAVGATGSDVIRQFIAEAVTLSLLGALAGIVIGVGVAWAVDGRELGGQAMTTVVQPWSIAAAVAVAAIVGFASGSYPAYRATLLDPIVALRSE
jgi:putative ABC transport system permease protein